MFGKKPEPKAPVQSNAPDLVVEKPETVGMPGFTADKPVKKEEPKVEEVKVEQPVAPVAPVVEAPKPVVEAPQPVAPAKPAETYQIVGVEQSAVEGVFIYKIVTNKFLGELGGVYEA